ncbi:MAG: type II toxin-antitoxin system PemK/MazF family toxin [Bacillota bacterium]|jgi:mRNA interferase MazF
MIVRRGEVFFAELNPVQGSEQGGTRPVLVVQNDIGNQYSPTTIIVAITSQINKAKLPTHVELPKEKTGLDKDSVILTEQVRTIDKSRLHQKVTILSDDIMYRVNQALEISLGLTDIYN